MESPSRVALVSKSVREKLVRVIKLSLVILFTFLFSVRLVLLVLGMIINPKIEEFNYITSASVVFLVAYLTGFYSLKMVDHKTFVGLLVVYFIFFGGYQIVFVILSIYKLDITDYSPLIYVVVHLFAALAFYFLATRVINDFETAPLYSFLNDLNKIILVMVPILSNDVVALIKNYPDTKFSAGQQFITSLMLGVFLLDVVVFKCVCLGVVERDYTLAVEIFTKPAFIPYFLIHLPEFLTTVIFYVAKLSLGSQNEVLYVGTYVTTAATFLGLVASLYAVIVFSRHQAESRTPGVELENPTKD